MGMRKKVIFLCLSVLLCTSTFGFADKLNIESLERSVEKMMEFCSQKSCPASTLETKANSIVKSVMKEVDLIQHHDDKLSIEERHIEQAKLLIKGVQIKISEYINKNHLKDKSSLVEDPKNLIGTSIWNDIIKAIDEDLNKASNLQKTVTSSSSKIETKLSLFSSKDRQISERLSAYEYIISLDLPYEEKTKYKQDVENPSSDFNAALMNAKATAKELKKQN
jgi:hypothetical protein